jgi:hypothetical protein
LFIELGKFCKQRVARIGVEIAAEIRRSARDIAPAEHMKELHLRARAPGHPGGVVAHAARIDRSVDQGHEFFHFSP